MKILITGATGLVGSAIMEECRKRGDEVHFLTTSKNKLTQSDGVKGFYWDPSRGEIDLTCFEGVDTVINLAGANIAKRWTSSYKQEILQSRTDSLNTLKKGIEQSKPSLVSFVSASAVGFYPSSQTELYDEEFPHAGDDFLGQVVKAWEKEASALEGFGFPVAKVRIGLVLSPHDGVLPQLMRPIKFYAGAPLGSGEQWQSWIHLKDLARLFLFLADHRVSGVFNGVAPNPVTNQRLTQEVASVMHKPLLLPAVPEAVLKIALGEMATLLFASQRVSSRKIEQEGFTFMYPNLQPALQQLITSKEPEEIV